MKRPRRSTLPRVVDLDADHPTEDVQRWSAGGAPSGRVLSGKFRVRDLLGAGGMGAVYVAEHMLTRRVGALKLLHASFAKLPDALERFLREASAAGLIGSPHIVETFDAGTLSSGEPYIFMELLSGRGLDAVIRRDGPAQLTTALDIVMQTARGLEAAHQAGIVHRDVKPANLFVLDGSRPFVKILDFGISKFAPAADDHLRSDLTRDGALLGTPVYMSPEQVMGHRDLDGRTDVFSLGVVLYELLTGEVPFQGDSLMQLSVNICQGNYVKASKLRTDLPAQLEQVLGKALESERERRFPSAAAFADALTSLCPELAPVDPALGQRSSRRPSRASGRVSEPSDSGSAQRSDNPSFVEAPTLEPHSTTDPANHRPERKRALPKRTLVAAAVALAALSVWFVRRAPNAPDASLGSVSSVPSVKPQAETPVDVRASNESVPQKPEPSPTVVPSTTSAARPPRAKAAGSAMAAPSTRPAGSVPAEQDGLSVKNPFREP